MVIQTIADIESADVLDTRDLIEFRDYMVGMQTDLDEAKDAEDQEEFDAAHRAIVMEFDTWAEFQQALTDLNKFLSDLSDCSSDVDHGEAVIARGYFSEYAQELADDCGMVTDTNQWPNYCIDWERAASELSIDYGEAEFRDRTFMIRCC